MFLFWFLAFKNRLKPAEKSSACSVVKVQEDEVNIQLSVEEHEINTELSVEENEINSGLFVEEDEITVTQSVDTREIFPDSDKYEDAIYRLGTNLLESKPVFSWFLKTQGQGSHLQLISFLAEGKLWEKIKRLSSYVRSEECTLRVVMNIYTY